MTITSTNIRTNLPERRDKEGADCTVGQSKFLGGELFWYMNTGPAQPETL